MPLKKDKNRRAVEMELELPGTPEQIWRAMATGPGYSAWFVPATIEEREGGAISFDLGGMVSPGTVTEWKPPYRFAYEEAGWSGEAPPLATEITIEAKAGGTCVVRMVHALFTDKDDWDKELDSMENGWPAFFHILRLYLQHFADAPAAASSRPTVVFDGSQDEAWRIITEGLALEDAEIGQTRDTSANGGPRAVGVVEDMKRTEKDRALTLRLVEPAPGFALIGTYSWAGQTHAPVSLFFYGETAHAVLAEEDPKWGAWLAENVGSPAGETPDA